jgi:hypothetical protein
MGATNLVDAGQHDLRCGRASIRNRVCLTPRALLDSEGAFDVDVSW